MSHAPLSLPHPPPPPFLPPSFPPLSSLSSFFQSLSPPVLPPSPLYSLSHSLPLLPSPCSACTDQSLLPSTSLSPPLHQEISPCPSFNSLNHTTIHSVLPPPIGPDSRSSSFIIEFNEEHSRYVRTLRGRLNLLRNVNSLDLVSCRQEEEGGCFRRQLLIDRDDLSVDSNDSYSEDFSRQGGTNDRWPHLS